MQRCRKLMRSQNSAVLLVAPSLDSESKLAIEVECSGWPTRSHVSEQG